MHLEPAVYGLELEHIWRPAWLFAAHSAELGRRGDRAVFDVGDDSVLLVRGEDSQVRAFHNFCRHRGTRLADAARPPLAAPEAFIRCPYHQWAYRLDGSLAACGGMDRFEGLDTRAHGLVPVECAEVGGLVFVRLVPPDGTGGSQAGPDISELAPSLLPQGLERARVAHRETYLVEAGWKVVWENNRECWHCHVGHPEYIKSHFDTSDSASPAVRQHIEARTRVMEAALAGLPTAEIHDGAGLAVFPSPGHYWSAHRTPLVDGFVTESLDGGPVAPLMASYRDFDVGVLRLRAMPNFWAHACADHAVTTRLAPTGPECTEIVVTWLVDEAAVEGRDFTLERLLPVWARTSEQDWALCERNQRGIRSPAYVPGPLSTRHEGNVTAFHNWYRDKLASSSPPLVPASLDPV